MKKLTLALLVLFTSTAYASNSQPITTDDPCETPLLLEEPFLQGSELLPEEFFVNQDLIARKTRQLVDILDRFSTAVSVKTTTCTFMLSGNLVLIVQPPGMDEGLEIAIKDDGTLDVIRDFQGNDDIGHRHPIGPCFSTASSPSCSSDARIHAYSLVESCFTELGIHPGERVTEETVRHTIKLLHE